MFNLVGKRYLFLIISLIVIVPGTISLIFAGLNVGIDFASGSSLEFRPQAHLSTKQVTDLLTSFKLSDAQIIPGSNDSIPAKQVVWIRLNTDIDSHVQDTIKSALQGKYGSTLSVIFESLTLTGSNGKTATVTIVTVSKFQQNTTPKVSDIQQLLSNLPKTTSTAPSSTTATVTPTTGPSIATTPTPAATPKATPTARATATPSASGTPTATATPTPSSAGTIPVNVVDIRQGTVTDTITIRTLTNLSPTLINNIKAAAINNGDVYLYTLDNATVSASVASETTRNAFLAVLAASVLILLYIWFSFRKVSKPWRYGACAIIALLHDVLVVLGVFSILGWTLHVQIDALFITAVLTVVGFSVHDTIVVFDRIRENMQRRSTETFEQVVNASLVQTMARSLNTSLTVLFTLSALTLFGGESIRTFTLALLVGIFSGTYSSIFNASMLLVIWERGELGLNRFNRDRGLPGRPARERELARTRG